VKTGVVVFEDEGWWGFAPLTAMRHTSQLRWGVKTLFESLTELAGRHDASLWGRPEFKESAGAALSVPYNAKIDGETLFVNARLKPLKSLSGAFSKAGRFVLMSGGQVAAAKTAAPDAKPGPFTGAGLLKLAKGVERFELPGDSLFEGAWDLVETNGLAISEQAGHFEEPLVLQDGVTVYGPASNVRVHASAEVEDKVVFDARLGPVIVDQGAAVESFSRLSGPCYIGPRTRLHSALVRGGTSVFEHCKIGGEVENSIVMPFTNKAHHGYVGDAVVGEWVNLGAGSTFSNLKNTYGNVRVTVGGKKVDTGMLKFGPVIGDMAKVSIGGLVTGGKKVGTGSHVSGLVNVDVPAFTYFDGGRDRKVELLLTSAVETQRRMMERRGKTLERAEEALIRRVFEATRAERRKAGVRRGKLA
jgi:UDP-N-acetylglucosamine diphosphorylase/glucosamine-1-phosphate N-acetyltransferase